MSENLQNSLIIGLGGHIDHGKTSFIKALNNFDGDSRSDEKERGITIDLSFSELSLGERRISFIDVPGHEKLVKNMIKGAFGIDVFALIVALDDGIMPQTLEHINIAYLLGINRVIVFLSKADICEDLDSRLSALEREIRKILEVKKMEILGVYPFSSKNATMIENAKNALAHIKKHDKSGGIFRYYCDRVFSKKGFGVVVTGTMLGGELKKGDKIFICDSGLEASVKTIHNHDKEVQNAHTGQRIALNLTSNKNNLNIQKGFLLSKKGYLRGFDRIECVIYPLSEIANLSQVSFFIGSRGLNATINILHKDDSKIFATLILSEKIFSIFKERFIIRSDGETLGGGFVLNPISDPMKKSQKLKYCDCLLNDDFMGAFGILIRVHKFGFGLIQSIQRFNLTHTEALEIASKIDGVFVDSKNLVVYDLACKAAIESFILNLIEKNKNAIFSANSLANSLSWASSDFIQITLESLEDKNLIKKSTENLYLGAKSEIVDIFEFAQNNVLNELILGDITPESPYNIYDKLDIDRNLGDSIFKKLTSSKRVVRLAHNVFVLSDVLSKMMESLREIIKSNGSVDLATFKRHFDISRKYLVCYLDYLDRFDDIERIGDKRVFKGQNRG